MSETKMTQKAPYPVILEELVSKLKYRPGWKFLLSHMDRGQGSVGLTLRITTLGYDAYHPSEGEHCRVNHLMIVPAASFNRISWTKWLHDQLLLVETHECGEFFRIGGKRVFAPHHGPGNDPYVVFVHGSDEDKRTMFTGEVRPPAASKSENT